MFAISRKAVAIILCVVTVIFTVFASVEVTLRFVGIKAYKAAYELTAETSFNDDLNALDEVYDLVKDNYYTEVEGKTLCEGAIEGMLSTLEDPYTFYYTAEELNAANKSRAGDFVGIGVSVGCMEDGDICILRTFKNSPAAQAGVMRGDILVSVEGKTVSATTSAELDTVVSMIGGEAGTSVYLEFQREDTVYGVTVERQSITNSKVDYMVLDNGIGYILLYEFFGNAAEEVAEAIESFEEEKVSAIVFDIRDNGGGSVDVCTEITDMFLEEGIIFYTEDRNLEKTYYRSEEGSTELPLAVLINSGSASASEIFASAIKDNLRGILVGTNTYGKGIMQTTYQLYGTGSAVQITTAEFFSPNGNAIHKIGVSPDITVEEDEATEGIDYYLNFADVENDAQLKAACEYLLSMR